MAVGFAPGIRRILVRVEQHLVLSFCSPSISSNSLYRCSWKADLRLSRREGRFIT